MCKYYRPIQFIKHCYKKSDRPYVFVIFRLFLQDFADPWKSPKIPWKWNSFFNALKVRGFYFMKSPGKSLKILKPRYIIFLPSGKLRYLLCYHDHFQHKLWPNASVGGLSFPIILFIINPSNAVLNWILNRNEDLKTTLSFYSFLY